MQFTYNPETYCIETDDPEIFIQAYDYDRMHGMSFVVNYFGIKVGFRTSHEVRESGSLKLDDGTYVWLIGVVAEELRKNSRASGKWRYEKISDEYFFKSKEEQVKICSVLLEALENFSGHFARKEQYSLIKAEFTKEAQEKLDAGAFLAV
ncbi:hypothetical protein [Curvivirga sp.]|uniref:hypothetical protein n=1 Tax=Curvivirga sp. TaxID=2856848 RepID=UPI003B5CDD49